MFLLGGIIVEEPIMMMLMCWVLPFRANRRAKHCLVVTPEEVPLLVGDGVRLGPMSDSDVEVRAALDRNRSEYRIPTG